MKRASIRVSTQPIKPNSARFQVDDGIVHLRFVHDSSPIQIRATFHRQTLRVTPRKRKRFPKIALSLVVASSCFAIPQPAKAQSTELSVVLDRLRGALDAESASLERLNEVQLQLDELGALEQAAQRNFDREIRELSRANRVANDLAIAAYVAGGNPNDDYRSIPMTEIAQNFYQSDVSPVQEKVKQAEESLTAIKIEKSNIFKSTTPTRRIAKEARDFRRKIEIDANIVLARIGITIPASAFISYQELSESAFARYPLCPVTPSFLAAIGQLRWQHGEVRSTEEENAEFGLRATPRDWLRDQLQPEIQRICLKFTTRSGVNDLDQLASIADSDPAQATAIVGLTNRYASQTSNSFQISPIQRFRTPNIGSVILGNGDVAGMLAWSFTRIGTPYSQCLGPDRRPSDPICPPGTNRFGNGFFDCSGFVSTAYRQIGILLPQTTMAMESSDRFYSSLVATSFDDENIAPGDVFLMDGHTGIIVNRNEIIHARGGGLTREPLPLWVANGTFAIFRPTLLLITN